MVMPNHFHAVLEIIDGAVSPATAVEPVTAVEPGAPTVGDIVGRFNRLSPLNVFAG